MRDHPGHVLDDLVRIATTHFEKVSGRRRSNTEEFIAKAKNVHGDKYDYSKVDYKSAQEKIIIICPKHGEFEQLPNGHLRGQGCPKCSSHYTTVDEAAAAFIAKAKEVHGDKYDYSKADYVFSNTKVTIICPKHGEFEQSPNDHLRGKGCPDCAWNHLVSTGEFISRANKVHKGKYNYNKADYQGGNTKITIICPEHGEFEQRPRDHLRGSGCPKCNSFNPTRTRDEFISLADEVHDGKYDYSKVNYINAHTKITIICPEHGEFTQLPYVHLRGAGCPYCGGRRRMENPSLA